MSKTMNDIINDAKTFCQVKQASYSDIPGAEHDKPAPNVSSDKEVSQGLAPNATSPAGAKDGAGNEITTAHALDTTEPAKVSVKKESEGTASLANDLLASVKKASGAMAEGVEAVTPAGGAKEASTGDTLELTTDVLAKMASVVLSTEEGYQHMHESLTKAAGAEAAEETFTMLEKTAAQAQGEQDAETLINAVLEQEKLAHYEDGAQLADAILEEVLPQTQEKAAAVAYEDGAQLADAILEEVLPQVQEKAAAAEFYKLGQDLAATSMMGLEPEAITEAGAQEGGDATAQDAMAGMAGAPEDDEVSMEELVAAVEAMVSEGTIDEATAQELLSYVGSAGAMPEAAGAMPGAAEGAADEGAGMEVQASAGTVLDALATKIASARRATRR